MYAQASLRPFRTTSVILAAMVLAACGQGSGPDSIPGTLVPPPEPCDSINFEKDCPQPGIVNFNGGATIVVDNPDQSGINTSDRVARMQKFPDQVFGGTLLELGEPIDFSQGEFYKVKVWSPRPVTVTFKLEEQGNPEGGLPDDQSHPGGSAWEELCFDFTGQNVPGDVVALSIIFDNGTLGQADTDPDNWTFFYDDITQVESCAEGPGASIIPDVALTGADPDLVIPDDYEEITAFGSGSVIDPLYADDETFSPVLSVFSGTGYGANVAQVGFIGFPAGFLTDYETVDFKVKGMPNLVIFVKLFDGVDALRLNLTRSDFSTDLGDGWYQVSIPVARFSGAELGTGIVFESDNTAPTQFRMLLTDVGFSGTGTRVPADAGIIPDVTLFDRDGTPDLVFGVDYTEISAFGSGADLDDDFRGDIDFRPAWAVTTGFGYSIWNAQLAYLGFDPGFAAPFLTLDFKVKGLSGDIIRLKFLNDPDPPYVDINVTTSAYSTALGNGWYQVSVPITEFAGVDTSGALLFETVAPPPAESFTYLLTDIGFSGEAPVDTTTSVGFEGDPGSYSFDNFGGGVSTVIANPDPAGINTSGQVVQMTRTSESNFGGSTLALPAGVDWSQGDIFRMKVWSQRSVPVLFKVEGSPPAERSGTHDGGSVWQELCFDFSGENAGAPVTGISIFFDLGVVGDLANNPDAWTFFYDDIEQSSESCPGPISVDFEGDAGSVGFDNFGGGVSTVTANPDPAGINTSGQVVQMTRTSESNFGGSTLALPAGVDWSQGDIFTMKVWSQRSVPVLFKVEGSPPAERTGTHDGGSVWQELCFDFSGENAGAPVTGISIFFDLGVVGDLANNPDAWTFYYDDIEQTSEPCPVPPPPFTTITFDDPETTYTLTDFGGTASTVTNDPAGGANQVVLTVKSGTAQVWAGTTVSTLPGEAVPVIPLDANNTEMSVRVFSPDAGIPVLLKIEDASNPAIFVETIATTTVVNTWEALTFDFSNPVGLAFDPGATYDKISIFFNFGTDGATAGEKTYYFDDIALGPGEGGSGGGELLTNGDFEASDTDKAPWVNAGGIATNNFYTADALDGQAVFQTNLSQVVPITQGAEYVLTFRARASVARDIIAGIGLAGAPFTAETATASLTTEWQSYTYNLTAVADIGTADSRVLFDMGGVTSTVEIDDVDLALASAPGSNLLTNGDFEASDTDKAPWINQGTIATNNFYTADAFDGQQVFETNLSQVAGITQGEEYVLSFRARASVARDIIAGIGLAGAPFTAETATASLTTEWQSYTYNLTAVADIGTADSRVLFDMGGVTSTVEIDDVSLSVADAGGGGGATGELAVNGGFESGDFAGWERSPNGGTITITTDSSAGTFAANLNIAAAGNPTLKAANLGAGALTPGQQVTVSFDWKGSDANGGVVDIRLFSELSGGGVSATEIIREGAGFPANWTTVGPLTITTGPDVSGGVTLQFTAICGAVAGCVSDVYIDNVSIVAN